MKGEKKWQAECDMRTLAQAEEIKSDRQRLATAKRVGKQIVKEKQKEIKVMQKIAKSPVKKRTAPKPRKSSKRK